MQAGAFVPEAVLDHPEVVAQVHRDFVHAGSDVVEAFTYYAHREKLRIIGREHQLEAMNRQALAIAKAVAAETGALFAGDICNTNVFDPAVPRSVAACRAMFEEQVEWAAEAGVDYVIAETFSYGAEAKLALEIIKAAGLRAAVTMTIHREPVTRDGMTPEECCRMLADAGADVVGLNCIRGPRTMLPLIARIVRAVDVPVAALPVPYRTHSRQPTFQSLRDRHCDCIPGDMPFPVALDPFTCNRFEIAEFAQGRGRPRRALHRPVLRGDAASYPQHRRGARPQAAGEPLFGRHVEARLLRHQCAVEENESRVRAEALKRNGKRSRVRKL